MLYCVLLLYHSEELKSSIFYLFLLKYQFTWKINNGNIWVKNETRKWLFMLKISENGRLLKLLSLLPKNFCDEITTLILKEGRGENSVREIMIRRIGISRLVLSGENIPLRSTLSKGETEALVRRLTDGALYAHRDSIASGYISLDGGVRVGVCGLARYDGERLVGISEISSLLFRIPGGGCDFGDELYSVFAKGIGSGMLIYSPPGVGKTTALRHLAGRIGNPKLGGRVCVVDERMEFLPEDYRGCDVDILRGYKRRLGIEIATRTLSPGYVMIDEIGGDDALAIVDVVRCGIPIIASAHAASFDEIKAKRSLSPLISMGAFSIFVGILREGGRYALRVNRL